MIFGFHDKLQTATLNNNSLKKLSIKRGFCSPALRLHPVPKTLAFGLLPKQIELSLHFQYAQRCNQASLKASTVNT